MQSLAMDTRDKTLLVSAAAGSGKTATLTERIIRSILDEENPVSIENMLVVTFTRLAATELRERISGAIKARLAADPGNARLERQMYMLPSARINTIDSFCIYILRENAERVGIESGFRIPDEAEAVMLGESILEGLFNEIADGGEIIAQKAVEVQDGDTPEVLQRRVMEQAEWVILPESVAKLCSKIRAGD